MDFGLISAGFSAFSSIQQGKAEKRQAKEQERMYQAELQRSELEALQRHNDRLAAYDAARGANQAWFAFANRDSSDRSVKAFLKKQREVAYTDVSRSDTQGYFEAGSLAAQARMTLQQGRTAQKSATVKALSTIASGLHNYGLFKS